MLPYKRKENQNVNISYDEFFNYQKLENLLDGLVIKSWNRKNS